MNSSQGTIVILCASALTLQACGSKSDSSSDGPTAVNVSAVLADAQLTSGIVNSSHGDAVAAAADQSGSSTSFGFNLADSDNDGSSVSKSCAVSGSSAVVSVSSTINRSRAKTSGGGRVTVSSVRTGNGSSTRTWSMSDGTPVACNAPGTGAAVNFQSPDNLKLDIVFERSRNDTMTYTGPRVTRTASKSFTSSGSRSISWSNTEPSSGSGTYFRNKSVVIKDVKQSLTMTDKSGTSFATALLINTAEAAPLVVKVERNSSSDAVVSKTFVSGQVVAVKDSDATMMTTYSNLKLNYSENSCSISSGTAQIVIKDSAGIVLKTLTLGVDASGDSSLQDSAGEEVEGFALDPCDSEDVKL
jgi:hypothetical protein